MKKLDITKIASLLFIIALISVSCGNKEENSLSEAKPAEAQLVKVEFEVTGMTCAQCAGTIDKTLTNVYGVENSTVSLENENALVTYDANKTNIEEMKKAVQKAGYGIELKKN